MQLSRTLKLVRLSVFIEFNRRMKLILQHLHVVVNHTLTHSKLFRNFCRRPSTFLFDQMNEILDFFDVHRDCSTLFVVYSTLLSRRLCTFFCKKRNFEPEMTFSTSYWNDFIHGDDRALGKLYHELFEPLVFISYHRVKNMEVARDIVSELFVHLLATKSELRTSKWQHVSSAHAYLSAAVKNKSIDYLRSERLHSEISIHIPDDVHSQEPHHISESLRLLPSHETRLFQLHLDGYSNHEIAEQTMISEKTVRNRLSMTRQKMALIYNSLLLFSAWIIVH